MISSKAAGTGSLEVADAQVTALPAQQVGSAAWVDLVPSVCLLLAVGLWYVNPTLGPWPLLLVGVGVGMDLLVLRRGLAYTPFDPPLALLLFSAALSAWLSAMPGSAWPKFWEIVSSLVLFRAIVDLPECARAGRRVTIAPRRIFFGLLPAMISLYFLLTTDWSLWMGKMPWLDQTMWQLARFHVNLPNYLWSRTGDVTQFNANIVGGSVAALLPLQVAALLVDQPRRLWLALPLLGISLAGLLLTASRGAWMGVAGVAVLWAVWYLNRRWLAHHSRRARLSFWLGLAAVCLLCALLVVGLGTRYQWSGAIGSRLAILRNSLDLALDYPVTGVGLGSYQMVYSTYVILLHVGFLTASHNFFLQVWLEQGLMGLLAVAWLIAAVIRHRPTTLWQRAAFASLGVSLIHGLVDVPLYWGRGTHLAFLPLAVLCIPSWWPRNAVRRGYSTAPAAPSQLKARTERVGATSPRRWAWASAVLIVVLGLALLPTTRAAFQANLGALAQTRAELLVYRWPEWPIQDALRRSPAVDLSPAIARYNAALALDPTNVTANRRLGQIELSRGEYDAARRHLEAAYAAAPRQRATRQLLGESYAIAGRLAEATDLWNTVDLSAGQLPARVWWYDHIGEQEKAQQIQEAAAGLEP